MRTFLSLQEVHLSQELRQNFIHGRPGMRNPGCWWPVPSVSILRSINHAAFMQALWLWVCALPSASAVSDILALASSMSDASVQHSKCWKLLSATQCSRTAMCSPSCPDQEHDYRAVQTKLDEIVTGQQCSKYECIGTETSLQYTTNCEAVKLVDENWQDLHHHWTGRPVE